MSNDKLGLSGSIAKKFLRNELTPLLALVGILMGFFAVLVTPREEEPQIEVTFANVFIPYPGATAVEVEHLVSTPAEQVLSEIKGVEHVYSVSRPGISVLTVQFEVGEDRTQSIVNLYNQVYSNEDWLPRGLGVGRAIVKPKGIDDGPIVSVTLWTDDPTRAGHELKQVANTIEAELKRVPGTRDIYTIGGPEQVVRILLDPQRMAGYNIAFEELRAALMAANATRDAGALVSNNREIEIQAGRFLTSAAEVAALVIGLHNGAPVYLSDVADVSPGPDQPEQFVWFGTGAASTHPIKGEFPAVTIAIAKQPGTNAAAIADQVIERVKQIRGLFIPEGIEVTVTRNYGATATDKAMTLFKKLTFATASVVLLVFFALGRREALIVGTAVVITLMITLFASWAWGFTLNRVSLFALIFSIGILVDDAIVVVENIHRHKQMSDKPLLEVIPRAVDEVGGPTILATFTVIAALLPMAFVTGLMGPYMSPIPINASMGMLISLVVAFVVTPWLTYKIFSKREEKEAKTDQHKAPENDRLHRLFQGIVSPFLSNKSGRSRRWGLFATVIFLILLAISLIFFKLVILKMLPFDNKSEFQVIVDMPEGSSVEQTNRVLHELTRHIATVPEVTDYQIYAGTAAPINFNGLVRQYYLRSGANLGDIQVNLVHHTERDRKSHEIALSMREPLQRIGEPFDANIKIVEVPPGPPVQAPLVAEIYGLNYEGQIEVAKQVRGIFEKTNEVVDVDDSVEHRAPRLIVEVDRQKAALLGVAQQNVVAAITAAIGGEDVGYLHGTTDKYAVPLRVELPTATKADSNAILNLKVRSEKGALVRLSEIVSIINSEREHTIYHKDLLPVVFVTGDVAGKTDSPLYGMFSIFGALKNMPVQGENVLDQTLLNQPENPYRYSLKWDGEWQITYETFRDMGIAYGIGMILIYLLIVAQFRSYLVPLIIMAPIPLTIIGVIPGHALLGANFTATSMIGMIALAGIIVRNSILLVDFINMTVATGVPLDEAVIRAGAVRAKPIVLTGLAAMIGAFFILDDPIFNGLAISLIFGILVSTLLTLVVIPVMYYAFMRNKQPL